MTEDSERIERTCSHCGLVYVEVDAEARAARLDRVCPRCHVVELHDGEAA